MCGIAGIHAYNPTAPHVDIDELRRIRDHMTARGPDDEGEWMSDDKRTALVHRRLSIIDLSHRSVQPMVSAGTLYSAISIGEMYDYKVFSKGGTVGSDE